jgi:hypothetical protein
VSARCYRCESRESAGCRQESCSQASISSSTNRSGPAGPPSRRDGIRPARAASYNHERDTPRRRASSAGLRSSERMVLRSSRRAPVGGNRPANRSTSSTWSGGAGPSARRN